MTSAGIFANRPTGWIWTELDCGRNLSSPRRGDGRGKSLGSASCDLWPGAILDMALDAASNQTPRPLPKPCALTPCIPWNMSTT